MNQDIKKRWVEALRSGKYRQGKTRLRTVGDCWCANGVLCDIAVEDGVACWELNSDSYAIVSSGSAFTPVATVPVQVQRWAGVDTSFTKIAGTTIADLNDNGTPFSEIADLIEAHL